MQKQRQLKFPERFLWGAATAAHQVEGGTYNQWSVWEQEKAKTLAAQAQYNLDWLENWNQVRPHATQAVNYISGTSADHFSKYKEDFDIMKSMGLNSYRFSIEWSRIEPEEGAWSVEAIEHYRVYIHELKQRGIEPIVTLFHFTLPNWFSAIGGFEKRRNERYFLRFIEKILSEVGKDVRYVITINEPEVYVNESYFEANWPPEVASKVRGMQVLHNLIHAHKKAAKLIHGMSRRYKVSIAKNSCFVYPGDNARLSRLSAKVIQYVQDDYTLERVYRHCDYIGMNYYFSNRVYGYRIHNPDDPVSDLGWDLQPGNIQYALERVSGKYKLPILITENGLADADDEYRSWWLQETIRGLRSAIDNKVDLIGYLHWSLLDNFEWAYGTWPRFGLVAVNYHTKERTVRASGVVYGRIVRKIRKESI